MPDCCVTILPPVVLPGWEIKRGQRKSRQSPTLPLFTRADVVTPKKSLMPVVTAPGLSSACCGVCRKRPPCLLLHFCSLFCQDEVFIWVKCQATSSARTTPLAARIRSLLVTAECSVISGFVSLQHLGDGFRIAALRKLPPKSRFGKSSNSAGNKMPQWLTADLSTATWNWGDQNSVVSSR